MVVAVGAASEELPRMPLGSSITSNMLLSEAPPAPAPAPLGVSATMSATTNAKEEGRASKNKDHPNANAARKNQQPHSGVHRTIGAAGANTDHRGAVEADARVDGTVATNHDIRARLVAVDEPLQHTRLEVAAQEDLVARVHFLALVRLLAASLKWATKER